MCNVTTIALNHNLLKGTIPTEFKNLGNIEFLHLESNNLKGPAPEIEFQNSKKNNNSYITDCGKSSFTCTTCDICCNDEGLCSFNSRIKFNEVIGSLFMIAVPFGVAFIFYFFLRLKSRIITSFALTRDPLDFYDKESVYCLLFSRSNLARFISIAIACIQISLFYMFLETTSVSSSNTVLLFNIRCSDETMTCSKGNNLSYFGWILFFVLTIIIDFDIFLIILNHKIW